MLVKRRCVSALASHRGMSTRVSLRNCAWRKQHITTKTFGYLSVA
jgi:hypothetical protein